MGEACSKNDTAKILEILHDMLKPIYLGNISQNLCNLTYVTVSHKNSGTYSQTVIINYLIIKSIKCFEYSDFHHNID